MKKCITDYDLTSKRVIIRVDFNVPITDGKIDDDTRIQAALKTIKYASDNGAKVILLSHLGRVTEEKDKLTNSLSVVAIRLSELLFRRVTFIDKTRGIEVEDAVANMSDGDILLLENTRFEDVPDSLESKNSEELAKYWASLGDIFITDAFGVAHRAHASNNGIAKYLPSGVGFLIEKEIKGFNEVLGGNKFSLILGGAKVKDKIGIIDNLIDKVDYLIIGGAMAYTFLKAKGINVGSNIVDLEHLEYASELLNKYNDKIILPVDIRTGDYNGNDVSNIDVNSIEDENVGYDIGDETVKLFASYIKKNDLVVVNGPMGMFEVKAYSEGTKKVFEALTSIKDVIICGGDTASAATNMGFKDSFTLISTGGGASLEMLAGNEMPGIDVINEK